MASVTIPLLAMRTLNDVGLFLPIAVSLVLNILTTGKSYRASASFHANNTHDAISSHHHSTVESSK